MKKIYYSILSLITIGAVGAFILENVPIGSNCLPQGARPYIEDRPYTTEEYNKIMGSCCFGLVVYRPKTPFWGNNTSCEPFYYHAFVKLEEWSVVFTYPVTWFYIVTSAIVILLIAWLVNNMIRKKLQD